GVASPIARRCETPLEASQKRADRKARNGAIASTVRLSALCPLVSRGQGNDAKPATTKVTRPAGTAKRCCLTSESVGSLDGAPRSGAQSRDGSRLTRPFPDYASLHPGYSAATVRLQRSAIRLRRRTSSRLAGPERRLLAGRHGLLAHGQ